MPYSIRRRSYSRIYINAGMDFPWYGARAGECEAVSRGRGDFRRTGFQPRLSAQTHTYIWTAIRPHRIFTGSVPETPPTELPPDLYKCGGSGWRERGGGVTFGGRGFRPAFARCCFCIAANLLVFTSPMRYPSVHSGGGSDCRHSRSMSASASQVYPFFFAYR